MWVRGGINRIVTVCVHAGVSWSNVWVLEKILIHCLWINPLFMNLCYIFCINSSWYGYGHTNMFQNSVFFLNQITAEIFKRPIHPVIPCLYMPLADTYHLIFLYVDSENGILGSALSFKQKAFSRMLSCDWLMAFSVSAVYFARIKENKINRNMIHIWLWKQMHVWIQGTNQFISHLTHWALIIFASVIWIISAWGIRVRKIK